MAIAEECEYIGARFKVLGGKHGLCGKAFFVVCPGGFDDSKTVPELKAVALDNDAQEEEQEEEEQEGGAVRMSATCTANASTSANASCSASTAAVSVAVGDGVATATAHSNVPGASVSCSASQVLMLPLTQLVCTALFVTCQMHYCF